MKVILLNTNKLDRKEKQYIINYYKELIKQFYDYDESIFKDNNWHKDYIVDIPNNVFRFKKPKYDFQEKEKIYNIFKKIKNIAKVSREEYIYLFIKNCPLNIRYYIMKSEPSFFRKNPIILSELLNNKIHSTGIYYV